MKYMSKKVISWLILIPCLLILVSIIGIWLFFYWTEKMLCSSTLYQVVNSPDVAFSAKIEEYDCGAASSWHTLVLVESKQLFLPGSETILSVRGRPDLNSVHVSWTGKRKLKITLPSNINVLIKKKQWRDVKINYISMD